MSETFSSGIPPNKQKTRTLKTDTHVHVFGIPYPTLKIDIEIHDSLLVKSIAGTLSRIVARVT